MTVALGVAIVTTLTCALTIFAAWAKVTRTRRDDEAASWLHRQVTRVYQSVGRLRNWYRDFKRSRRKSGEG